MIEIKNLTKTYGSGSTAFKALKGVSFSIPDGASVAITGKSGSGKSTLMHVMSGLDTPQYGSVTIDGVNIFDMKKSQIDEFRAQAMSFVFQGFYVEDLEICHNNVAVRLELAGMPDSEHKQRVEDALKNVGLADKSRIIARNLSGGQKQRLAIARAIVNEPKILFADEPTGNLDEATSAAVEDLLFDITRQKKTTLIIVTHNPALAAKCDMQVDISDGKVSKITHSKKKVSV